MTAPAVTHRAHVRSPVDVLRLIGGLLTMVVGILAAITLDQAFLGLRDDGAAALGRFPECVAAIRAGLKKGGIKSSDHAQISLGMCLYNEQKYEAAISAFREAGKTNRSAGISERWIETIRFDIRRNEQIELAEAAAGNKVRELAMRRDTVVRH